MTYEQFKEALLFRLRQEFPADTRIRLQKVMKNNGLSFDGLAIFDSAVNISPTIYLQPYYEMYKEEQNFSLIVSRILDFYQTKQPAQSIDTAFFEYFSNAKSHIIYKLINREQNKELLEDLPYVPFLDLAIVFCYYQPVEEDFLPDSFGATIMIHSSHLKLWNITTEELYEIARENTPRLLPPHLEPLHEMLRNDGIIADLPEDTEAALDTTIFFLSNLQKFLGAGAIFYPDLISAFARQIQHDLVIIPSSIHEVLLLPKAIDTPYGYLNHLVEEINETQVLRHERLSSHIYLYKRNSASFHSL